MEIPELRALRSQALYIVKIELTKDDHTFRAVHAAATAWFLTQTEYLLGLMED